MLLLLLLLLRFDVFMFSFARYPPRPAVRRPCAIGIKLSLALPIVLCARCCQFKCRCNYLATGNVVAAATVIVTLASYNKLVLIRLDSMYCQQIKMYLFLFILYAGVF